MSRRERNPSYYGRNSARDEGQDPRSRKSQGRDWEPERPRREEWQSESWRSPDERDYTARYLGYEAHYEPQRRFPATFGSYEDQRRVSRFEGERSRGYPPAYGRDNPYDNDYRSNTLRGQGEWRERSELGSARDYAADDYRAREDYRGYGDQREERGHGGHNWGQQLREASHEMVRKVKRVFRGPKGYKRSDERIREDVSDRLAEQDDFDPSEIEVSVANGEVTLSGSVRSRHEKFLAEEIADDVSAVTEVHNQIRVQPQAANMNIGGTTSESQTSPSGWTATGTKNRNAHS